MRINNTIPARSQESTSSSRRWLHVAVFYDDATSRDRAAQAEGRLISTLAPIVDLRFAWSSTKCLFHPGVLPLATHALRTADIILFSIATGANLSLPVRAWLETELSGRNGVSCALLALIEPPNPRREPPSPLHTFLRELAQQCGFDFLPGADQSLPARKLRPEQAAPLNPGMLAAMDRFSSLT
jgi:hypothetical protein